MKTKIASVIGIAILGIVIAFFITNLFTGSIEDFSYETVVSTIDANIVNPDPEVFNYRALNPTVEVYVGECEEYDEFGGCLKKEGDVEDGSNENNINNKNINSQEDTNNNGNSDNNANSTYDLDNQGNN